MTKRERKTQCPCFLSIKGVVSLERERRLLVLWGALLVSLWTASHFVSWPAGMVLSGLNRSVVMLDSGFLLVSATVLVVVNAVRAFFLYTGWFLLGQSLASYSGWWDRLVPLICIPSCYGAAWFLNLPSVPHFGAPAAMALISVMAILFLSRGVARPGNRAVVLGVLVLSLQWLDVIPSLTPYGFGGGELSLAIKEVAVLMERDKVLDVVGSVSFLFGFAMAMVVIELFVGYEKRLFQLRLLRERERELARLRQEQTRNRAYREMQFLVHDLKRPLTTVMGLADVMVHSPSDRESVRHAMTIQRAAERMDQMVSEIGDPLAVQSVSVAGVLDYALSQIRPLPWSRWVSQVSREEWDGVVLRVNLIRFSRALVNILENAHRATEGLDAPEISVEVVEKSGTVLFRVMDNGLGFSFSPRPGRSSWGSTGLGLAFVREVVEACGGDLSIENSPEGGAMVTVSVPKEPEKEGGAR